MVCPAIGLPPRRNDPLCGRGRSVPPPAHQEVLPSRPPAHGTVGQPSVARVSGREPLGGRRGAIVAGDGRLGVGDGEGGKGRCCRHLLCVVAAAVAAAATTVRLWVRQAHRRSRPTCGGVWAYARGAQWPRPGRTCPRLRWRSHRDWQLATEVVGAPAAAPTRGAATVGGGRGGGDVLADVAEEAAAAATAGRRRRLQRQRRAAAVANGLLGGGSRCPPPGLSAPGASVASRAPPVAVAAPAPLCAAPLAAGVAAAPVAHVAFLGPPFLTR